MAKHRNNPEDCALKPLGAEVEKTVLDGSVAQTTAGTFYLNELKGQLLKAKLILTCIQPCPLQRPRAAGSAKHPDSRGQEAPTDIPQQKGVREGQWPADKSDRAEGHVGSEWPGYWTDVWAKM